MQPAVHLLRSPPGQDHLLHAIGNYAQELHPSLDIRYVRAAEFGRQFAIAAGDGQQHDLRSRYLDGGMLLIDDVQLLPDAGAIQAEFLHVFTVLHNGGRQLVISADRAPRLLAGLDDSLRDRLERGLAAELSGNGGSKGSAHN
jgi:chromosomal replication initiator protein